MLNVRQEKLAQYQAATKNLESKKERLSKAKGSTSKLETEVQQVSDLVIIISGRSESERNRGTVRRSFEGCQSRIGKI